MSPSWIFWDLPDFYLDSQKLPTTTLSLFPDFGWTGSNQWTSRNISNFSDFETFAGIRPNKNTMCYAGLGLPFPLHVVGRCPPLPYFDHATLQHTSDGDVNSTAQFQCRPGYRFEDGSTLRSITCQDDLQWEPVDDCKGGNSCAYLGAEAGSTCLCLYTYTDRICTCIHITVGMYIYIYI